MAPTPKTEMLAKEQQAWEKWGLDHEKTTLQSSCHFSWFNDMLGKYSNGHHI